MLGGGQQGGQLGSSPGLQSVLQTALQGLQAPAANAGGPPAGAGGLASAGLQQPSVISMLTPGGGVALPLALASGSVQQQVTTASATSALPNMVHTQFNPPHVLVPANPYLHEGSYILLFYSKQGPLITDERNSFKWTYLCVGLCKSFTMIKISGQKF